MTLRHDDLALLAARFNTARFGASRFGFIPCPEDVEGADNDEPGEYIWREVQPPTTEWEIINEDCVCRDLCTLALGGIIIIPNDQTNRWAMDETSGARVDSGAALNLTDNNGVLSADGVISNAALFNSDNSQYLSRAANGTELYPQGDYTISLWIFPTGTEFLVVYVPVSKTTLNIADQAYFLTWHYFSNGYNQFINVKWTGSDGVQTFGYSPSYCAPVNRWTHVAFGYDTSIKTGRLWINGVDMAQYFDGVLTADPVTTGAAPFRIGAGSESGVGPLHFFDGRIDDVRIYDYLWTDTAEFDTDVDVTIYAALTGVLGTVSGHAQINWGDGRHDQQDFSLLEDGILSFTGHYHVAGNYTITVTVTDERGCVATATKEVTVAEPEPEPTIVASFTWEKGGETNMASFTDTSVGGADTWAWNFGDGSPIDTDQNPTHSYALVGGPDDLNDYTVTLTASLGGDSDDATAELSINLNDFASGSGS